MDLLQPDVSWRPIVAEGEVFLFGARAAVRAVESEEPTLALRRIDPADGSVAWETDLLPRGGAPELIVADGVVLCRQGAAVEAIDADSGAYLWGVRYDAAPTALGTSRTLFVALLADGITDTRDLRSGLHRWTLDLSGWQVARFEEVGGRLYALADGTMASPGDLAVFDATRPSATPLWHGAFDDSAAAVNVVGDLLAVRRGTDLVGVRVRDGSVAVAPPDAPHREPETAGTWLSGRRVTTEAVDGLVLRMRQVDAFRLGRPDTPDWSALLVASGDLVLQQSALDGTAILVASTTTATLLDAVDGRTLWSVPIVARDDDGRSCTVVGATAAALLVRCTEFGDDVLVALPGQLD